MRRMTRTALALFSSLLSLQALAASAAEIAEVEFAKRFQTAEADLELRGVGLLRYLGLIKAYAGAFYLEEGVSINEALADRAKRLEVEYFRSFQGQDFGPATVKMMEKNLGKDTLVRLRDQIERHNALYEDVEPGDRYALTYIPGRGTELALNGKTKGVIEGSEFAYAIFSIWLGKEPIDESFKRQIMGL